MNSIGKLTTFLLGVTILMAPFLTSTGFAATVAKENGVTKHIIKFYPESDKEKKANPWSSPGLVDTPKG